MQNDEQAIRQLVSTWLDASKAGDVETILSLMTDDVVFLVAGQPPMRKADFAAAAQAQSGEGAPAIHGASDIQEITVLGDWAYLWQALTVTITLRDGTPSIARAGHTMTIFRKQNGHWLLARDANMLAPVTT